MNVGALSRHCCFKESWKFYMATAQRCTTARQIKATHALFISTGLHRNTYAISKLLQAFYTVSDLDNKCLRYASLIFDSVESRNTFVYNSLIRIYSRSSQPHRGLHYFRLMLKDFCEFVVLENFTFHSALVSCVNASLLFPGRQIHAMVVKNGVMLSDGHVQTGLIRVYVEGKVLRDAHKVFDEITNPDVVQWNVLINGYVKCFFVCDALGVFRKMLSSGTEPDEFCVTTALTACAQAGALAQGKWIHEYVKKKNWFESDVFIGTALVDMYAKCGCIDLAVEVFERMGKKNRFSWAAIIGGFAVHGYAKKAIHCLEKMQYGDGIQPDGVVLLKVLSACTHGGLIEEGQFLLNNMESKYGISPKHEHYSCVVDLFCRAGQLNEALKLINRMPMKPLASVWGALLNSCRIHKNVKLAELAVENLLELEKGNAEEEEAAFVQLSNIYLSVRRSDDASKIRLMIGDRGLRKAPGCSVLEVDGKVNEFVSGDALHQNLSEIHAMLELLSIASIQNL